MKKLLIVLVLISCGLGIAEYYRKAAVVATRHMKHPAVAPAGPSSSAPLSAPPPKILLNGKYWAPLSATGHESIESIECRIAHNLVAQHVDLARLEIRKGRHDLALEEYGKLLGIIDRSSICTRQGFPGRFNRVLRGLITNTTALMHLRGGGLPEAIDLAREGFPLGLEAEIRARAHFLAGKAMDRQGRRSQAQEEYAKALECIDQAMGILGRATYDELISRNLKDEGRENRIRLLSLYSLGSDPFDRNYSWGAWKCDPPQRILEAEKSAILKSQVSASEEIGVPDALGREVGSTAGGITPPLLSKLPT
jgi:tetratricopeptide (TPR) repeat protein